MLVISRGQRYSLHSPNTAPATFPPIQLFLEQPYPTQRAINSPPAAPMQIIYRMFDKVSVIFEMSQFCSFSRNIRAAVL